MRTETIQVTNGQWDITYPDSTVWTKDSNIIKVERSNPSGNGVGASITVMNQSSLSLRTLKYVGSNPWIVFSLDDTLAAIYSEEGSSTYTVSIQLYNNGTIEQTFSFSFRLLDGKSLPHRSHGAERTIYVYNHRELYKLEIWFPMSGFLYVNGTEFHVNAGYNALYLMGTIVNAGTYHMCFYASSQVPTVVINSVEPVTPAGAVVNLGFNSRGGGWSEGGKGGDIWKDNEYDTDNYCIDLVWVNLCDDKTNWVEFRYLNADGLRRYIAGRVLNENISSEGDNFYKLSLEDAYRNKPYRKLTGDSYVIKVGFEDIAKNAYLSDIAICENIEYLNYANNAMPCTFESGNVEVGKDESQDYELEFCVSRE